MITGGPHPLGFLENNYLRTGLISVWDFEETTGTIAYDSYGSNNGTITNSPTLNQTGKLEQCFEYDGSYLEHVAYSNSDDIYSISCWFYNNSNISKTSTSRYLMGFDNDGQTEYLGVRFGPVTSLLTDEIITVYTSTGDLGGWCGNSVVSSGWHHLVLSWNGTYYDIYLDNSKKTVTTYGTLVILDSDFKLNRRWVQHTATYGLDGKIDQTAFWSKSLTPLDVSILYNSGYGLPLSKWG